VEGLEKFNNKQDLSLYVEQLNRDLKKQLAKKRLRKEKRKLKDQPWLYFAIVTLLVLLIICYVLVKRYKDRQRKTTTPPVTVWIYTPPTPLS